MNGTPSLKGGVQFARAIFYTSLEAASAHTINSCPLSLPQPPLPARRLRATDPQVFAGAQPPETYDARLGACPGDGTLAALAAAAARLAALLLLLWPEPAAAVWPGGGAVNDEGEVEGQQAVRAAAGEVLLRFAGFAHSAAMLASRASRRLAQGVLPSPVALMLSPRLPPCTADENGLAIPPASAGEAAPDDDGAEAEPSGAGSGGGGREGSGRLSDARSAATAAACSGGVCRPLHLLECLLTPPLHLGARSDRDGAGALPVPALLLLRALQATPIQQRAPRCGPRGPDADGTVAPGGHDHEAAGAGGAAGDACERQRHLDEALQCLAREHGLQQPGCLTAALGVTTAALAGAPAEAADLGACALCCQCNGTGGDGGPRGDDFSSRLLPCGACALSFHPRCLTCWRDERLRRAETVGGAGAGWACPWCCTANPRLWDPPPQQRRRPREEAGPRAAKRQRPEAEESEGRQERAPRVRQHWQGQGRGREPPWEPRARARRQRWAHSP
jgi:hypothetical protein